MSDLIEFAETTKLALVVIAAVLVVFAVLYDRSNNS